MLSPYAYINHLAHIARSQFEMEAGLIKECFAKWKLDS